MGMTEQQRKDFVEKFVWTSVDADNRPAPDDVKKQAWQLCEAYNLKPELKHLLLMFEKRGKRWTTYITRDGLLHVANSSGIKWGIQIGEPRLTTNPYREKSDQDPEDIYLECKLVREGYPDLVYGIWFSEYNVPTSISWQKNPGTMHAKIGQVYGLRIGFNVCVASYDENEKRLALEYGRAPEPGDENQDTGTPPWEEPQEPPRYTDEHERKERYGLYKMACEIGGEERVKAWMHKFGLQSVYTTDSDTLNKCVDDMRAEVNFERQLAQRKAAPLEPKPAAQAKTEPPQQTKSAAKLPANPTGVLW